MHIFLLFGVCSVLRHCFLSLCVCVYRWKINFRFRIQFIGMRCSECICVCWQFNCRSILSNQKYKIWYWHQAIIRAHDKYTCDQSIARLLLLLFFLLYVSLLIFGFDVISMACHCNIFDGWILNDTELNNNNIWWWNACNGGVESCMGVDYWTYNFLWRSFLSSKANTTS